MRLGVRFDFYEEGLFDSLDLRAVLEKYLYGFGDGLAFGHYDLAAMADDVLGSDHAGTEIARVDVHIGFDRRVLLEEHEGLDHGVIGSIEFVEVGQGIDEGSVVLYERI